MGVGHRPWFLKFYFKTQPLNILLRGMSWGFGAPHPPPPTGLFILNLNWVSDI